MYSPKVPEELIPRLWRLAQERKVPMTHLVRDAVVQYLTSQEGGKDRGQDDKTRGHGKRDDPGR